MNVAATATIPPSHLNGHEVISYTKHGTCSTVMVLRANDPIPYVVATWWPGLGTSWMWGHYCEDHAKAVAQFDSAMRRNEERN
jgi:hypothetical protein